MATVEKDMGSTCPPIIPINVNGLTSGVSIKLLDINEAVLQKLKSDRLTADHVFILQLLFNRQFDLLDLYDKNFTEERALLNYQGLERKQLIVPDPADHSYYIISLEGTDYFLSLVALRNNTSYQPQALSRQEKNRAFDEWWNTYPSTTYWVAGDGRVFTGDRALRSGTQEENRKLYFKILNEGIYAHQQLLACLKYEIAAKKRQSLQNGSNCLHFMQNSLTYLRNRTFEHFMELSRQGEVQEDTISNLEIG